MHHAGTVSWITLMTASHPSIFAGVVLAVIATLGWALNFIAPYVTSNYSLYDLMTVRFLIVGVLGVAGVLLCRAQLRLLRPGQRWLAAALGALGCLGYGLCIGAGVMFGGPVLTPAFVGMVPVLLALIGNTRHKTVQWRRLAAPLACLTVGLLLSNISSLHQPSSGNRSWLRVVLTERGRLVVGVQRDQPKTAGGPARASHPPLDSTDAARCRWHDPMLVAGHAHTWPAHTAEPRIRLCPRRADVRLEPGHRSDVHRARRLGLERGNPAPAHGAQRPINCA